MGEVVYDCGCRAPSGSAAKSFLCGTHAALVQDANEASGREPDEGFPLDNRGGTEW